MYNKEPNFSLLDLFYQPTFLEKWGRVSDGLKMPKETGENKWARFQLKRLWAPFCAVTIPILVGVLLVFFAVSTLPEREYIVTIVEPEPVEELDKPLEIIREITETVVPNQWIPDMPPIADPTPPSPDFSPMPALQDTVAIIKSPIMMKGILGSRSPGMRGTLLGQHGGSGETEGAVMRALRWLAKNQNDDGSWNNVKPAMTGLALLTFLAHGETPSSDEFGRTVEYAIRWLCDNQDPSGRFKGRDGHDYSHPIATYALCEAFSLTRVPMVRECAEKAVSIIVKGQNAFGGWNYNCDGSSRNDLSYIGWCVQAMKAAYLAGITPDGFDAAMAKAPAGVLKNCKRGDYCTFGYTSPGNTGLTAVGVLCLQLLGKSESKEARGGLGALQRMTFNWNGGGVYNAGYYWYYGSQSFFHAGGEVWNSWNRKFSPVLVTNQDILSKEQSGYVDHEGTPHSIGWWDVPNEKHTDGTVMDTSLCALQLQVYYRYLPTYAQPRVVDEVVEDDGEVRVEIDI